MNKFLSIGCSLLLIGIIFPAWSLDHKDAPLISQDTPGDLGDLFVFDSPSTNGNFNRNTVFALTVNPLSAPTEPGAFQFASNVRYQIHIDLDGEFPDTDPTVQAGIGDLTFTFSFSNITFSASGTPTQRMTLDLTDNNNPLSLPSFLATVVVTLPTVATTPASPIIATFNTPYGVGRLFAGPRDDASFGDAVSFGRVVAPQLPLATPINTILASEDTFAGFNVSAIVMDFPLEGLLESFGLNDPDIQIWSTAQRQERTLRRSSTGQVEAQTGRFMQIDRTGNPLLNSLVVPPSLTIPFISNSNPSYSPTFRDFVNIQRPLDDITSGPTPLSPPSLLDVTINTIRAFGVDASLISDADLTDLLKLTLIPDTLKYSTGATGSWPFNGRLPQDDALDLLFSEIVYPGGLGGGFIADGVPANDVPFLSSFPFLPPPKQPL